MKSAANVWRELASLYSGDFHLIEQLWTEIKAAYSSKNRYYHSLEHLEYMLELAFQYQPKIRDFNLLLFAIFYHDFIYDISRKDNERKSAELAHQKLSKLGLPDEEVEKCCELIRATAHHHSHGDNDTRYLLDFDLAILGESPENYDAYANNIRREYSQYPDWAYEKGRNKVLRKFIERDRIFQTDDFLQGYEKAARKNLSNELHKLRASLKPEN